MNRCTSCPSYMDSEKQETEFNRTTGVPICGTFMHVLSTPTSTPEHAEAVAITMAEGCPGYGKYEPPKNDPPSTQPVFVADPTRRDNKEGTVMSCFSCANYLPASGVKEASGFPVAACAATGSLILSPARAAQNCTHAKDKDSTSMPPAESSNLVLVDMLMPEFRIPLEKMVASMVTSYDDPATYESDREVTAEDSEMGIRAWRKIEDKDGRYPDAWLPIYRFDFFTEEEQAMIPKGGDETHPELYIDYDNFLRTFAVEAFELDETIILIGEAGTGKTERLRWIAWMLQVPYVRISLDGDTQYEDVFGRDAYHPDKGTYFEAGRFTKAWARPSVIVLDEFNLAPRNIREQVRPCTDNSKQLVVASAIVDRSPGTFLALTQNPPWTAGNVGTEEVALADANRLTPVWVDLPPEPVERKIIKDRCAADGFAIPEASLDLVMKIAGDLRGLCDEGQLPEFWGVRQQIKVARKLAWYEPQVAFTRAALDFYPPETRKTVLTAVRSHIPGAKTTKKGKP